jgi:signal transduction histidine kinase
MKRPQPGHARELVSFWRFNLGHELVAAAAAGLALFAGSSFTLDQLQRRYIQLHRADAERVGQLLEEHLREARQQLNLFHALPPARQVDAADLLLNAFSDLYWLNGRYEVEQVLKASAESRVFPGFSFAGSRIRPYLDHPQRHRFSSSGITRGLEDELASVYFTTPQQATPQQGMPQQALPPVEPRRLLARLNLRYLQLMLARYSKASGVPVLLVSRDGFVMLSSDPRLSVPAVNLRLANATDSTFYTLTLSRRSWIPIVAHADGVGGHIVTLIPAERLEAQRSLVIWTSLVVVGLILVVFVWKNHRLNRLLFTPVAHFTRQMEAARCRYAGLATPEAAREAGDAEVPNEASSRFLELAQIQAGFEALMQAIRERDLSLQQKLRTSLTAAAIAHEINLPLSTIRFSCQRADQQLAEGELDAREVHELVHSLQSESRRVSEVIERMRMLLRNVETTLEPVDLVGVAHGALARLKGLLREQQVRLRTEGLEAGPLLVMGDAVQLQMALANLLRNAIEASAERPLARRRVVLSLGRREGWGVLSVADSGPGFALAPDADTLLRSSKPGGTGLGLFVVRTTLANHRGRLRIERSRRLGGAKLLLELPLLPAPAPAPAPATPRPNYSQVPMV